MGIRGPEEVVHRLSSSRIGDECLFFCQKKVKRKLNFNKLFIGIFRARGMFFSLAGNGLN